MPALHERLPVKMQSFAYMPAPQEYSWKTTLSCALIRVLNNIGYSNQAAAVLVSDLEHRQDALQLYGWHGSWSPQQQHREQSVGHEHLRMHLHHCVHLCILQIGQYTPLEQS